MSDNRAMRFWLAAAIVAVILAGSWFFVHDYYLESNAFDCYPACNASQNAARAATVLIPVALVLMLAAAVVRGAWNLWRRRRRT
jgi:hypothetical protein